MRITRFDTHLLHIPLDPPRASPSENEAGRLNHVVVLLIHLGTDTDQRGLGFAYALQGSGRALQVIADDDLAPLVIGEEPLDHERLAAKVYWRLQSVGRRGLVAQAYSAVDLALWDLKGKAAGLPLYKLLGGARESAPVYGSDSGWLWMSPDEMIAASRRHLDRGMAGVKLKVGGPDPEKDAGRVQRVRDALGEEIWLAVDANQRYDYATALAMGRFFEEEIGVDWFEEPINCEDVDGHARLAAKLEAPIALGETLFGLDEFERYLEHGAVAVMQPDVTRLGGLTPCLRVLALAERHHRPVAPHLLPEVAVHLACAFPQVTMVEYMPWLYPVWIEPPAIVDGRIVPPPRPGLGLEVTPDAVAKYARRQAPG
jgi:L-alanine-DL-glutamate epimerase-like enolase superfamily enzyme